MEEPRFLESDFDADVDLTPLIDVVFMLLLFFILAATFSQPVLEVALPAAGTAHRTEEDPDRLAMRPTAGRRSRRGSCWRRWGGARPDGARGATGPRRPAPCKSIRKCP